jgi:hypothetical protein
MSRKAIATMTAALTLVGPAWAIAAERPDDRPGMLGVGGVQAAAQSRIDQGTGALRPDDRAGVRGPGAVDAPVVIASTGSVAAVADGFDWTDAAIGALGAIAVIVLAGALGLAAVRARQGGHATA